MITEEIVTSIKEALINAQRNTYVAELHLQILKYAQSLHTTTGKEFCEAIEIAPAYATEYSKMLKIWPLLKVAGLDVSKI